MHETGMSDFFDQFAEILTTVQLIQRFQADLYVHGSKLNGLIQSLKQIPVFLDEERAKPKGRKPAPTKTIRNISHALEQFSQLATQCGFALCARYVLNSPVKSARRELKSIRRTLEGAFDQLKLPRVAHEMKISRSALRDQDLVDLKRISDLLVKMQLRERQDVAEQIAQRFRSLRKLGIQIDATPRTTLVAPDIPANLQLIVTHEEVTLCREIARGESATVYVGKWREREVAVKVFHLRVFSSAELESYRREISVLSNLSHPSILSLCAFTDTSPFYVLTDFLPNGSLFKFLRAQPENLSATARSVIAYDVARGIEFLHSRGVIHRDVKSLNVLLDANLRAKIADFGAVRLHLEGVKTRAIGTVHWMAPELLMSSPDYDFKVDIYSFGLVLWELLTGELLFPNMKPPEIIALVMNGQRPPIPDDAPPALVALIKSCWDQDSRSRPQMTRVVTLLGQRDCCFTGTDPVAFQTQTGVVGHHRSTGSASVTHRHGYRRVSVQTIDLHDPRAYVRLLSNATVSDRASIIRALFDLMNHKSDYRLAIEGGICGVITELLDERNSLSETVLGCLLKCTSADIFEVGVLKSLLDYAHVESESLRTKALSALIVGAGFRFALLKTSPSFLLQICDFLRPDLPVKLASSVLQLGRDLLPTLPSIPPEVVSKLLAAYRDLSPNLQPMIITCLCLTIAAPGGVSLLGTNDMELMLCDFQRSRPFLDAFACVQEPGDNDHVFVGMIVARAPVESDCADFLAHIATNLRFARIVVRFLPLGGGFVVPVYRALLAFDELWPSLLRIDEFYAAAAQLVASKDLYVICPALKSGHLVPEFIARSKLCVAVAAVFGDAHNQDDLIMLMGAVYSISQVCPADEFVELLPKLFRCLHSSAEQLRVPGFLAIVAVGRKGKGRVDWGRLRKYAHQFFGSSIPMVKQAAAELLNNFDGLT
jgi:serine/threonine protein kinase